ncbi:hypothetical protein [Geoalkalibacter halelectricus]|uniref:Uncharacterized protein n=1 Tax=Geoalkalibacter halelectricus TaxID=2847045 RepID=A0ABY5ZN18_9BACT|nr:hypothetical protein [Geoalkalibacter halelectricus]MDO3378805.1 hypothetical protein [Geoalkalibacter halelectricus]UWZ79889.1 hypothetical protein L9S41_00480 [Geoalkalibacter halelectricus]
MTYVQTLPFSTLLIFALGVNVPLGYLRQGARKYSLAWFTYIHLSIPFIILWRLAEGLGWEIVPFTLGCALLGQFLGGRLRRDNTMP